MIHTALGQWIGVYSPSHTIVCVMLQPIHIFKCYLDCSYYSLSLSTPNASLIRMKLWRQKKMKIIIIAFANAFEPDLLLTTPVSKRSRIKCRRSLLADSRAVEERLWFAYNQQQKLFIDFTTNQTHHLQDVRKVDEREHTHRNYF